MKFFVAGVYVNLCKLSEMTSCDALIKSIQIIVNDAKAIIGDDVIVVIALHEYALTPIATHNKNKKEEIRKLKQAIEPFENVILVPGSLLSYQLLNEKQNKKEEIQSNYSLLSQYTFLNEKSAYRNELKNFQNNFEGEDTYYLQNSTYMLTKNNKHKHKKSTPIREGDRLGFPIDYIYDIGVETLARKIQVRNEELDMRVLVCLEHHLINTMKNINVNPPLIELIVSASTCRREANLYGALCIHMDSKSRLYVGLNSAHNKASFIHSVKARCYTVYSEFEQAAEIQVKFDDVDIHKFETAIQPECQESNKDLTHRAFNSALT